MTAKPNERRFNLPDQPGEHVMNCIYQWAPSNSVYAFWVSDGAGENSHYTVVFHRWQEIDPAHQTALELMLSS